MQAETLWQGMAIITGCHKFSIEDVDNGSQIAVVFRVYNNYSEEKSLERVYLESQRGKIYAAENKMPVTIKPKKFFDCIFAIKSKQMLEEGLSKTVAHIEELKTDIKSLRESLKPQKAEIKQTEKEIAKLEAKKAAVEAKAAEAAKKVEAEAVLKKLLASGMTADDILEKLK